MLKAFERAGVLYLLTIGVTLPLIVISEGLGLPWATGLPLNDPCISRFKCSRCTARTT